MTQNGAGSSAPVGDPMDAIKSKTGTYVDPVTKMPEDERLPMRPMPKAPDPAPFGNLNRVGGNR